MRTLIAANWKMNGMPDWVNKPDAFNALLEHKSRTHIDVLICPPFPLISALAAAAQDANILIGAQNCHDQETGAHTGEVSAQLLAACGVSHVIIGHSERRASGERDADVRAKAQAAQNAELIPIICVGESLSEREAGHAEAVVAAQLSASLPDPLGSCVIAYEPIWAIGTGLTPTSVDIAAMHAHIRQLVGSTSHILYGGSVKPGNAAEILGIEHVNGALIGGASLEMESLVAIARAAL